MSSLWTLDDQEVVEVLGYHVGPASGRLCALILVRDVWDDSDVEYTSIEFVNDLEIRP